MSLPARFNGLDRGWVVRPYNSSLRELHRRCKVAQPSSRAAVISGESVVASGGIRRLLSRVPSTVKLPVAPPMDVTFCLCLTLQLEYPQLCQGHERH